MPDIEKRKLSDEELKVLVDAELDTAMGFMDSELTEQRSIAQDRYLGEPLGTEMEGRSQVMTRDTMNTIEWIMPTLIRIFTESDRAVEFIPVGPEDEQPAEQEADVLNHIFYKENNGFLVMYTFFKDALLSKTGQIKLFVEEFEKVTKEEYANLTEVEYQALSADEELEEIERTRRTETIQTPEGPVKAQITDVVYNRKTSDVRFVPQPVPPEEFLISNDADSIEPWKARFTAHRTTKTISDLREMGFKDKDIMLMDIGENEIELSEERLSRLHLAGEERYEETSINTSMRKVNIAECYMHVDMDGDGVAELIKVFRSGDFIEWEDIDYHPFSAITPIILTHKFFGLSIADIVNDIQEIRTMLFRSYMDNINQAINGTTYYDENTVNLDDMLTSKPYGIRGVDGSPGESILHIPPTGLPSEAFNLNELLDTFLNDRIGDFRSQVDPNVLAQANTGVVIKMLNEAKAKVEMIARIFAETGVKDLFRTLHHLVRKHSSRERAFKINGQWVPVDPRQWRERTDMTVNVGLGTQDKTERLANLTGLMDKQLQLLQMGAPILTPQDVFRTAVEMTEAMDLMPEKYWTPPEQIPPPPPPDNSLQEALIQIEAQKVQLESQKVQLEAQKAELANERKAEEIQIKAQNMVSEAGEKNAKMELEQLKVLANQAEKNAEMERKRFEMLMKDQDSATKEAIEAAKVMVQAAQEEANRTLSQYQSELQAAVQLAKDKDKENKRLTESLMASMEDLRQDMERDPGPQEVITDEAGRIVQIGKKRIVRDGDRVTRIE